MQVQSRKRVRSKDILVTGATGFLGKRLLPLLVKKYGKERITCLAFNKDTPFETSGRRTIKKLGVAIKNVDLVTGIGLDNLPSSPSLIFHLAANTETLDPDHRCNNVGTKNLINAFAKVDSKTHVIHISTLVLFAGRLNCKLPITQITKPSPTNEYTRTKLEGEKFMIKESKRKGFRLTVIRPNTIYGEQMRDNSLFDTMQKMVKKQSLLSRINWPGKSSLIYVEDLAKLIMLLSEKRPPVGKPNIVMPDPEQLSLSDLAEIFYTAKGIPYQPIILPNFFWDISRSCRKYVFMTEKILPTKLYNWLWRFTIIVDDVIYCDPSIFTKLNRFWKPQELKEVASHVIK